MQSYELAEFAALIAFNGGPFLRDTERLSDSGIQQYWSASRDRIDNWRRVLADGVQEGRACGHFQSDSWLRISAVLDELFVSGILTRVWTAIACEHDDRQGNTYVSPVVRSVMLAQMEARHRALILLDQAHEHRWTDASGMNRLRSKTERWTDLLLAHIAKECPVAEFAFDAERVQDFADDLREDGKPLANNPTWQILQASLSSAFRGKVSLRSPNGRLNQQIASAILASFPPDLFDTHRLCRSVWMDRLNLTANDAQVMLDELMAMERPRTAQRSFAESWVSYEQV